MTRWTQEEIEHLLKDAASKTPAKKGYSVYCRLFGKKRSFDAYRLKVGYLSKYGDDAYSVDTTHRQDAIDQWLKAIHKKALTGKCENSRAKPTVSQNTSLILQLGDLHFGKQTEFFDSNVARERLMEIPQKLVACKKGVDEIVVLLLGDLVEGVDIYPNQSIGLEFCVFEQVKACVESLWAMLVLLGRKFPQCNIRVEGVPGNHGRTGKTAARKSNWDNVILYILQTLAKNSASSIDVGMNSKDFNTIDVKGHSVLLCHRGVPHVGTPARQIKASAWKLYNDADILVHGHWHEWGIGSFNGSLVFRNGSLCGPDGFGERSGLVSPARQGYFFVAKNRDPWGFSFLEW